MKKAVIIGSGVGGLAVSIRLAHKGYNVAVYEANAYPGGKLTAFELDNYRFDAGPSLFTLPHLVDELFELCGEDPRSYFDYKRCNDICHYFWDDGDAYVMPADEQDQIDSLSQHFGLDKSIIRRHLTLNKKKYNKTKSIFLERSLHKVKSYLSTDVIKGMLSTPQLQLFRSLDSVNTLRFGSNEKLVQLFNRYATYNGSSPYKTPGIMSMIPHLEMNLGTYFPKGGMIEITKSLYKLAKKVGVSFHLNTPVESILHQNDRAYGIVANGKKATADIVVSNADVSTTYERLLTGTKHPKKHLAQERSSSALIFYWGIDRQFQELGLHNIFFSKDYKAEFADIFERKIVNDDPTVYINITSKYNPDDAAVNGENWFVMINTPGDFGQDWDTIIPKARQNIIEKINARLGVNITDHIDCESMLTPALIESKTSSLNGSLYGTSSNNLFSAFLRHPNFSRQFNNLFFVGGSVHPGGGIPLCLNSAKIVSNLIDA